VRLEPDRLAAAPSILDILQAMHVSPHGSEPAYKGLARVIREGIATGRLRPGDPLPARRALATALGVSVYTVEHALKMLAREALVGCAGQGTRVFVTGGLAGGSGGGSAAPRPAHHLVGQVQEIVAAPEGVTVHIRLVPGQDFVLATSRTAVAWLGLTPGKLADLSVSDAAVTLTVAEPQRGS